MRGGLSERPQHHRLPLGSLTLTVLLVACACDQGSRAQAPAPAAEKEQEEPADAASCQPDATSGSSAEPASIMTCGGAAGAGSPLIDDFEDGNLLSLPVDGRSGAWFTYTDGSAGCVASEVADAGDGRALHLRGSGFTDWGAGFGTVMRWSQADQKACVYDASSYRGLRFRAKGNAKLRVNLQTRATTFESRGGECADSETCFDQHGRTLYLEPEWREFELDFCQLAPEGWGGERPPFDSAALVMLNIQVQQTEAFDLWIDDVSFIESSEDTAEACGPICPEHELPLGVEPAPTQTSTTGVELHTFEQPTPSCGAVTRRYLAYVPDRARGADGAPVLLVLHGSSADAESMRDFMTQRRFEALADRDGFVVVYGNAVPGQVTTPSMPNGGAWRFEGSPEVDDHEYLKLVIEDLRARSVLSGDSPLFLTGLSNGGGMVLHAAMEAPERYRGVAAIAPYVGAVAEQPERHSSWATTRVLIAYAEADPGMPSPDYNRIIEPLPAAWATALGVDSAAVEAPVQTDLPDRTVEGESYTGDAPNALGTRDSRVTQIDFTGAGVAVRALDLGRAGHFWPVFEHNDPPDVLSRWGLRNQDLDASDAVWEFFATAL